MTSIEYNAVNNLILFLEKDIDISCEYIVIALEVCKQNKTDSNVNYLQQLLSKRIEKRINEVKMFNKILSNNDLSYMEQKLYAFKYLPFKDSNIEIEKNIFAILLNNPSIIEYYDSLISSLSICDNRQDMIQLSNQIRDFIYWEQIGYDNFKTGKLLSPIHEYPSDKEIINRFRNISDYPEEKNIIIGQYSEMICYYNEIHKLYNLNRQDLAQRVIWVSKEVGDGFGYDIFSFNLQSNHQKLLEVKGTTKADNEYNFELSANEYRTLSNIELRMNDNKDKMYDYIINRICFSSTCTYRLHELKVMNASENQILIDQFFNQYSIDITDDIQDKVKIKKISNL